MALATLELLPTSIWLLGADGNVLHTNPAARRLMQQGNVIVEGIGSRPYACVKSENKRLQALIESALRSGLQLEAKKPCAQMLWEPNGSSSLHILVTPITSEMNGFAPASAVVFATAPHCLPLNLECNLRSLYELTPAEARLASALVAGESMLAFAQRTAISETTARTHMKHILAKTNTRRQSDLLRIIMTGPAMLDRKICTQ